MTAWLDQRVLLRVMIAALAAAGLLAALRVLVLQGDLMWRTVGSALLTAVAAGALLTIERRMATPKAQAAAQVAALTAVAAYGLTLLAIWEPATGQVSIGVSLWMTALSVLSGGMLAAAAVRIMAEPDSRGAGWTGVAFAGLTGGAMLMGSWSRSSEAWWAWWPTAWVTFLFGSLGVGCLVLGDRLLVRPWRWAGVAAAGAAWLMSLVGLWTASDGDPWPIVIVGSVAAVAALSNVLMLAPLPPRYAWLRWVTLATAAITAVLVDAMAWMGDALDRFPALQSSAAAAAIATGTGSLIVLVMARLGKRRDEPVRPEAISTVALTCPHCEQPMTVPVAEDTGCDRCGLRLNVRVYEPRCTKCEYPLYYITSGRCPECGEPVSGAAVGGEVSGLG